MARKFKIPRVLERLAQDVLWTNRLEVKCFVLKTNTFWLNWETFFPQENSFFLWLTRKGEIERHVFLKKIVLSLRGILSKFLEGVEGIVRRGILSKILES